MRRTDKVARKVQTLLGADYAWLGSMIFNPVYEYVVNGVIVDGTSYKDTVVVYRTQRVFFEKELIPRLGYTERVYNLADPSQVTFFVGQVEELATQIATTLDLSGAAPKLLQPYTLNDFLDQHWPMPIPNYYDGSSLFEVCCATFLTGGVEQAIAGLQTLKQRYDTYIAEYGEPRDAHSVQRYCEVCKIAALLDGSNAVLRQHIIDNITENAQQLGFQPIGTRPQRA